MSTHLHILTQWQTYCLPVTNETARRDPRENYFIDVFILMLFRAPGDPNPYPISDVFYPENIFDLAPTVEDPENDVSFLKEWYPIFPSSLNTMSSHNA